MPNLNFLVTANVTNANQGLQSVQKNLAQTAAASAKMGGSLDAAGNTVTNFGRVLQDLPFGFIGIQNNLNPLVESFQRLKAQSGSTGSALSAIASSLMGAGGIGLALSAVTAAVTFATVGFSAWERVMGKTKTTTTDTAEAAKKAQEAIHGIFEDTAKEATTVQSLVVVLESETATRLRKLGAIKELQRIEPEVFANLKLEGDAVTGLDRAYQSYLANLSTVIAAKIKQQQLEQITTQLLEKQGVTQLGIAKTITGGLRDFALQAEKLDPSKRTLVQTIALENYKKAQKGINDLQEQQATLLKELGELQAGIKVPDFKDPKPVKEKVDQIAETLRKLKIDQEELARNPLISIDDKDTKNFDLLINAISRLRELKLGNNNAIIIKLRADAEEASLQVAIDKFHALLKKTGVAGVSSIPIPISFELRKDSGLVDLVEKNLASLDKLKLPRNLQEKVSKTIFDPEKFKESTDRAIQYMKNTTDFAQKTLDPVFSAIFDNIGKGSQTALQAVGEAIKGIITQLVRAAAEAAVLSLILNAIFPGAGGGQFSFGKLFSGLSGIPKFAEGGLVAGPTVGILGEGVGISGSNPEVVAPLNKLRSMIGGSGGVSQVEVVGSITGNNINISNSRTNTTRRRLYGK
jgi:hypothetical protein